jgi:hypothetical protein
MGRRKKPERKLRIGTFYFLDRRIKTFLLAKKVLSRQRSANRLPGNVVVFRIKGAPENNVLMVASHEKFFGKEYAKVMVGNTENSVVGYVLVSELKRLIRGNLKWVSLF